MTTQNKLFKGTIHQQARWTLGHSNWSFLLHEVKSIYLCIRGFMFGFTLTQARISKIKHGPISGVPKYINFESESHFGGKKWTLHVLISSWATLHITDWFYSETSTSSFNVQLKWDFLFICYILKGRMVGEKLTLNDKASKWQKCVNILYVDNSAWRRKLGSWDLREILIQKVK